MPDSISYFVPGDKMIPVVEQTKTNDCWAAVTTMLISWKNQQCYSVDTVMDLLGGQYREIYEKDSGLSPEGVSDFINASGLTIEWPVCGTVGSILELLQNYGPVIMIDVEYPSTKFTHARVVTGIHGDGTPERT
jgi:hypothetical protein